MNFKEIRLEDKAIMDKFLLNNPYGICDYSFTNIYIWRKTYQTEYAIHKDHLILRAGKEEKSFLMPLGEGNKEEVIKDMMAQAKGEPFRIASITPHMKEELEKFMPAEFKITNPDLFCDYIYLSESLITLRGKKLAAKRNHINKFMALYGENYEYLDIDDGLIEECKEMNKKWCKEKDCTKDGSDYCETMEALNNFTPLGLKGGALRVNGEIVAFTLGQPVNSETFNVCIEKALTHVEGAYTMINREFAARNASEFKFINREEDMGVEGLKKAKLSYNPYLILEKGQGVLQ